VKLHDAYLSVHEALKHAGSHHGAQVHVRWVDAENMSYEEAAELLERSTACSSRRLRLARLGGEDPRLPRRARARDPVPRHLPRHARRRLRVRAQRRGLEGANSTEMDPETPYPVIDLLPEQKEIEDLGGTMRLGAQAVELGEGTRTRESTARPRSTSATATATRSNNQYRQQLVDAGLVVSGTFQEGRLSRSSSCRTHRGRREPVPPRVQVAPDAPGAALPRVRRRRAGPRPCANRRAAARDRRR
jgi:CTP synthase